MKRKQNIQRDSRSPFERAMSLARIMTPEEKTAVVKAYAAQLGQPLYTVQDVRNIVNEAIAATHRRQPLLDGVKDFAEQMARLKP